jgi:hypothetical protein
MPLLFLLISPPRRWRSGPVFDAMRENSDQVEG